MNNVQRTIPPKKMEHLSQSKMRELLTVTIEGSNLREAVKLPPGEDINEWLALNTMDFYKQVRLLCATFENLCTPTTCPIMKAGRYECQWVDVNTGQRHKMGSATEYIGSVMNWIGTHIDNDTIFPKKSGEPFPPNFKDIVKRISRKLFNVYAHIYRTHFLSIVDVKEEAHLNTCFQHFILFMSEYQLMVDEHCMAPLKKLVEIILEP
ncbi:putative MOB kinase activator-like 2B isoform X1 [Capsella rubella]|nr:putative MOB kinase activator-like 2B isoform X1 [Capsella rubella]XP_023643557.1 putative MOB kinase activator-like 2B isoform X1 [Capsella rubella]XP_023643560.1 putative MOB kinase activator-like 2B isoform X1 [Capsella rubella]